MSKSPKAIIALRTYGSGLLDDSDLTGLIDELEGQGDRAFTVIMGSMVEHTIEHALRRTLRPDHHEELFGFNGALGTFSNKILMGCALRIYGKNARRDLDYVRHLRNAAAHSKRPFSFELKIISDSTALLRAAEILEANASRQNSRDWFFQTCRLLIDAISAKVDGKPLTPAFGRLLA